MDARAQAQSNKEKETPAYALGIASSDKGRVAAQIRVRIVANGEEHEEEIWSPYVMEINEEEFEAEIQSAQVDSITVILKTADMKATDRYFGKKVCVKVDSRKTSLFECNGD